MAKYMVGISDQSIQREREADSSAMIFAFRVVSDTDDNLQIVKDQGVFAFSIQKLAEGIKDRSRNDWEVSNFSKEAFERGVFGDLQHKPLPAETFSNLLELLSR